MKTFTVRGRVFCGWKKNPRSSKLSPVAIIKVVRVDTKASSALDAIEIVQGCCLNCIGNWVARQI